MHKLLIFCWLVVLAGAVSAQDNRLTVERKVHGNTLQSAADPAITLTFAKPFHYAGGQAFDIFQVAGAEQHLFVESGPDRAIRRFYWVQFEHYYANNKHTYDYSEIEQLPLQLGRFTFQADTRVAPNYFTGDLRPGSDSEATLKFLRDKGYKVDGDYARVRMFLLPDDSKRKELMIIYGEAVAPGAAADQLKKEALQHAREWLKVR